MNLQEVRDSLLNDPLSKALLKAKVLASILKASDLRLFVDRELNGYGPQGTLPSYRIVGCANVGHFRNSRMTADDQPIPLSGLPDAVRQWAETYECAEGIGGVEHTIRTSQIEQAFWVQWPNEYLATIPEVDIGGYGFRCFAATKRVSIDAFVSVVESVRSRVLDTVLALAERFPGQTATEEQLAAVPPQEVTTIVQTVIYGDHATVASGANVQQNVHITPGDLVSLIDSMQQLGVPRTEREALSGAIALDKEQGSGMGPRVKGWLADLTEKALTKSVEWGVSAALPHIIDAIRNYFA